MTMQMMMMMLMLVGIGYTPIYWNWKTRSFSIDKNRQIYLLIHEHRTTNDRYSATERFDYIKYFRISNKNDEHEQIRSCQHIGVSTNGVVSRDKIRIRWTFCVSSVGANESKSTMKTFLTCTAIKIDKLLAILLLLRPQLFRPALPCRLNKHRCRRKQNICSKNGWQIPARRNNRRCPKWVLCWNRSIIIYEKCSNGKSIAIIVCPT